MKNISANLVKWPAALGIATALLVVAFFVHAAVQGERAKEKSDKVRREKDKHEKDKKRKPGEVKVDSDKDDCQVVAAQGVKGWCEPLTVYGRVVPNPQAVFEVRASFAGTLRKDKAGWLFPGQRLRAGQTVGFVDIRIDPQVRLDVQSKLTEAQHQEEGAAKTRAILEKRVKRFAGAGQSLPPRELEEALIQLRETRTKEEAAKSAVKLWTQALADMDQALRKNDSHWTRPLMAPAAGEVTELLAQPGTSVEAGGVVARLVDFRRLLVRLDFPSEALAERPPRTVQVAAGTLPPPALRGARNQPSPGRGNVSVGATLLRQAPQVDSASQFTGYFYEIDAGRAHVAWRPGLFVRAELTGRRRTDALPRNALSVPATALLYHQGRALIYLRVEKEKKANIYARREVEVLGREGERWVLAANPKLKAGALVVARNAQDLLAEEFITDEDD